MATSQRVQVLTDKSEELKVLKQFLDNPNLIDELSKEVVKLNALTEAEQSRLHETQILLQKKDRLEADYEALKRDMAKQKADHENDLSIGRDNLQSLIAEEKKKLEDSHSALDIRKASLEEFEIRLNQRENKLKEQAALIKGIIKD